MQDNCKPNTRPLVNQLVSSSLDLTGPQKWVLVCLVDHLNTEKNGSKVWPSVARLSSMAGVSERTVQRCLQEFHTWGLLRADEQPGKTSIYYLNIPEIRRLEGRQSVRGKPQRGDTVSGVGVTESQGRGDSLSGEGCHSVTLTGNRTGNRTGKSLTGSENREKSEGLKSVSRVLEDTRFNGSGRGFHGK